MTQKGKDFERETAHLAGTCSLCGGKGRKNGGKCKHCDGYGKYGMRIPRSGSIGTIVGIPEMQGDAKWHFPWLSRLLMLECKHGYSTKGDKAKSIRVQRDWFVKHMQNAKNMNFIPAFAMKFKFTSENGISKFILIPFSYMTEILRDVENLYIECEQLKAEVKKLSEQKNNGKERL